MEQAALVLWVLTMLGGIGLAVQWVRAGGRDDPRDRRHITPTLLAAHAGMAVIGLAIAVALAISDEDGLAVFLLVVLGLAAAGGFTMMARWFDAHERETAVPGARESAELHMPAIAVTLHGLLAFATLMTVIAALPGGN